MVARPRLKEQFRPLRRGGGQVQLGQDPGVGVVLDGLGDDEVELLERLDGSLDEAAAAAWAAQRGIPAQRVATLLATLRSHALTVDSPADRLDLARLPGSQRAALRPDADALACAYRRDDDGYAVLARRTTRSVLIHGCGTLTAVLAQALRQAGVGRVVAGPYAADARPPHTGPDLVVLAAAGAVEAAGAQPWLAAGIPHLAVVLHGTSAEVGPLVRPGTGPCLRCLDLTRTDLDPAWPALLAQLAPASIGRAPEASGETSLVFAAAGLAAMVALATLDGQPPPPGRVLEVGLPLPRLGERIWAAHPECSCAPHATGSAPGASASPRQGTMAG